MTNPTNKNTALLVIDIVNFCCHEKYDQNYLYFTKIRKMIPKLVKFIDAYKKEFAGEVIYINCTEWDKEHLPDNINELYKDPYCRYYPKNPKWGTEFYKVQPGKKDTIITKNTYDAFSNPKLDRVLKMKGIKNLVITGIFGDACVHATIQGGFSKGYNFIILKDLIETTDAKIRQDLQKLLRRFTWPVLFGKTMSSREFIKKYC